MVFSERTPGLIPTRAYKISINVWDPDFQLKNNWMVNSSESALHCANCCSTNYSMVFFQGIVNLLTLMAKQPEMSGYSSKHIQGPRSQNPTF